MSQPKASVIVLTWNGIGYLKPCLDAVLSQDYANFEVIIVDNGSTDGSPDLVAEHYPQVQLIRSERNLGFAAGNNVGLLAATGDLLVLLNQDTRVRPGWLLALVNTFADPTIGMAGCKLLYPDGMIQHAGGYLYGPRGESDHVGRYSPDDGRFDRLTDAEFVTAAALAVNRTALEQIGPLDEEFAPAYYEDVDWCYRARAAGFRVVYQPRAVVTHHESASTASLGYDRKYAVSQGRLRFLFKHRTLHQLLSEFVPAELAWVAATDRNEDVMAVRRAYLKTMLSLPGILSFRDSSREEASALVRLLADLRAAAVAELANPIPREGRASPPSRDVTATGDGERVGLLEMLQESQTIREHVFTSKVPVIGPLIVAVRNLWNSVATKWYVRPLIQQQNTYNTQVMSYLRLLTRDVAENMRELTDLAEQLSEMQAHASATEHKQDTGR